MIHIRMRDERHFEVRGQTHFAALSSVIASAPQQQFYPGAWGTPGWWKLPVTEPNCRFLASRIVARFGSDVEIDPDARNVLAHALLSSKALDIRARRIAEYTFHRAAPTIADYDFRTTPFKHQIVAFDAIRGADKFALFAEMGTGKTKVAVDCMCYDLLRRCGFSWERARSPLPTESGDEHDHDRRTGTLRVLVLAPKSVCPNWGRELAAHATVPFAFAALRGAESDRLETIVNILRSPTRLKVVAINYESADKFRDVLSAMQFHLCIADESTRIKTPTAKRTRAAIAIARTCERRLILTGQPITKNVLDLYSQFEFLGPDEHLLGYSSFAAFKRRYTETNQNTRRVTPRNVEELKECVGRYGLVVKKQECLDLPAKVYTQETIRLSPKQREVYNQVRQRLVVELLETDARLTIRGAFAMLIRLAQVTSGFIPSDRETEYQHDAFGECRTVVVRESEIQDFPENPKLDRCIELIDDIVDQNDSTGAKVIVWCRFRRDILNIKRRLVELEIPAVEIHGGVSDAERETAVRNFNENDAVRVLIGQPQSGGLGLTLIGSANCPVSTEIFFSNDFSLESRLQAEDRAHRIGMHRPVTIVDLVCEDTIDEIIRSRLISKKDFAEGFTDGRSMAMAVLGVSAGDVAEKTGY